MKGQFNSCPLLWMFCSYSSNNLINKTHERALRLTSEINDIPFNELLSITADVSIHNKNIQTLLIEVYKNLNGLSPPIMLDLFTIRNKIYNLRNFRELYCEKKRKPSDMTPRPTSTRQLSYRNYYRVILKTPQH